MRRFGMRAVVDPAESQTAPFDPPGQLAKPVIKGVMHRLRHFRAIDQQPHFRIQRGRARIEVERPDEHTCTIHGKGLGMQGRPR